MADTDTATPELDFDSFSEVPFIPLDSEGSSAAYLLCNKHVSDSLFPCMSFAAAVQLKTGLSFDTEVYAHFPLSILERLNVEESAKHPLFKQACTDQNTYYFTLSYAQQLVNFDLTKYLEVVPEDWLESVKPFKRTFDWPQITGSRRGVSGNPLPYKGGSDLTAYGYRPYHPHNGFSSNRLKYAADTMDISVYHSGTPDDVRNHFQAQGKVLPNHLPMGSSSLYKNTDFEYLCFGGKLDEFILADKAA